MATYTLSIVYRGSRFDLNYYPAGNGGYYQDHVSCLSQVRDEMTENCDVSDLMFYYTDQDGDSVHISRDRDLRAAVAHLDSGDVLGVTAVSSGRGSTEAWTNSDSEEEESSDEESSDEEESEDEQDSPYYNTEEYTDSHVDATLKRFVQPQVKCYNCKTKDWTGLGYAYYTSSSYKICDSCYDDLTRSEKRTWVQCGLPWDEDVPSYPLYTRADYQVMDEVCHLQYILTRLGYMSLKHTRLQTGSYQGRTQEAVRQFREQYEVYGRDMTKYDKKTATKLAQVVRQYRRDGHSYL